MIAQSFKSMNPSELDVFTKNIIQRLSTNASLVSLKPQLDELIPVYEAFSSAKSVASLGGKDRIMERETRRLELMTKLTIAAKYVEILATSKPEVILASGFEERKAKSKNTKKEPIDVISPPNFKVLNTPNTGEVRLSWMPVDGVRVYAIEHRQKDAAWKNGEYTTNEGISLSGYELGSYIEFKVRTIGEGELKSDWSSVVGVWVA